MNSPLSSTSSARCHRVAEVGDHCLWRLQPMPDQDQNLTMKIAARRNLVSMTLAIDMIIRLV
jgi:hypothetical protein